MTGSVSMETNRVTKNRWKIKKRRKVIEAKSAKVFKEYLQVKNYQQGKVFRSKGGSNEKPFLKLAVPNLQIIFTQTYLF